MNNSQIISLNQIWACLGITDLSFLAFFKISFTIFFILINLGLLYSEFLDNKNNIGPEPFIKMGVGSELKKIGYVFIASVSAYATYFTIKSEHAKQNDVEVLKNALKSAQDGSKRVADDQTSANFSQKLHWNTLERGISDLEKIRFEKSNLMKEIEATKENENLLSIAAIDINEEILRKLETTTNNLERSEEGVLSELKKSIEAGTKFTNSISKENNDIEILKMINDVKKSSVFDLDEILTRFESLDGISKLAFVITFSSSIILWCLLGIMLNIYGGYLLNRFNLEERYPKLATIIKYRQKLSRYYILSNFLIIISVCLVNITLGLSIFSL